MLKQLLLGGAVSLLNIAVHAAFMASVIQAARSALRSRRRYPQLRLMVTMVAVVGLLLVAHFIEVAIWAVVYHFLGVASTDSAVLYFALVNYTTLGYGDITPVESWRLMGPFTAMNGILLFGWSTAVIFEILRKALDASSPTDQATPSVR